MILISKELMDIKRITNKDNIQILWDMHKDISKFNRLKDILIYYDDNFFNYLLKIVDDSNEYFYGLFNNNKLEGFVHFKIFNDTLFLNNFFINESFRGGGVGSKFLKTAIEKLGDSFSRFSLDVLVSNTHIYNWYERLGLNSTIESQWVKLLKEASAVNMKTELIQQKDFNNFNSIFHKELKIATIVSNEKIIVHNLKYLDSLFKLNYDLYYHGISENFDSLSYVILEKTIRMEGDFREIFKKLKNA